MAGETLSRNEHPVGAELDEFLGNYSPEIRDLALSARELIFSVAPDAQEKVYPGWKVINYSRSGGMKDLFCGIGPQKSYVNIYLNRGTELQDPAGLLEGSGKGMRHVKIRKPEDLQREELRALVSDAANL